MAKVRAKKVSMSPEELKASEALAKFNKEHEGKELSDAQKKHKAELTETLGKLKFVRIANKRVPAVLKAISGVKNLAGKAYVKTPGQVAAICDAFEGAVKSLRDSLSGVKAASGFKLPGFEEKADEKK